MTKSKTDENLVFLFMCLMNSGGVNSIDFNAVAEATNIKIPAARMRWSRLKAKIEKEMADGPDHSDAGEPSAVSTAATSPAKTKSPAKKRGVKRKKISEPEDDGIVEHDGDGNASAGQEK
ncbi:hypothetical protein BDV28DRAFT_165300 [Aspergillus coremiiformis]|uniref:Myb-like DNA-binding domain-containing protein n=1 Tax=Aspergillus coremiiformis TaxID=138285 RepID=A0A5N6Z599_9EURO|nr:hypothetical protein BDV28DRAFT_165300 [Aspergillus coremiiformis]